jgi:hypothetical protein
MFRSLWRKSQPRILGENPNTAAADQLRTVETQAAKEPERQKNDQHQTHGPAKAWPTIPTVPVIATAAAEQQNEHDNDQNCTHFTILPTADAVFALSTSNHQPTQYAH